jgi:hypothetical protein
MFIYYLMFVTTAKKMEAMLTNANGMLQYRLQHVVVLLSTKEMA